MPCAEEVIWLPVCHVVRPRGGIKYSMRDIDSPRLLISQVPVDVPCKEQHLHGAWHLHMHGSIEKSCTQQQSHQPTPVARFACADI